MKVHFKFNIGDLVIYHEKATDAYRLFHIHDRRNGRCNDGSWGNWYAGYLLSIKETKKFGGMFIPVFETTLTNASEKELRVLKDTKIQFDIWNKMKDR